MLMVLPLRAATKDVLLARILPDRTTLYAGDSMLVSVVLYATAPIAKAECTSQFVVKGKCDVRKLDIDRNATAGRTREGRQMYYTLVWNQYVVAPQRRVHILYPYKSLRLLCSVWCVCPTSLTNDGGTARISKCQGAGRVQNLYV